MGAGAALTALKWDAAPGGAWREAGTRARSRVPITDPCMVLVGTAMAALPSPNPRKGAWGEKKDILRTPLCIVGGLFVSRGRGGAGGIAGCCRGTGTGTGWRWRSRGTALVLAATALMWFVGRAPRQTSCSQLRQAPACPVPGSGPASSLFNPSRGSDGAGRGTPVLGRTWGSGSMTCPEVGTPVG